MRCIATFALVALCSFALPLQSWGAEPVLIPKESDGYTITRMDPPAQSAPAGYDGRTEISTLTAVGNTEATKGKTVVARFTLGNQIKICPAADGTSEGKGVFSIIVDATNVQPTGTSRTHVEMRANAKYKGQVGDDALFTGPVDAEIEYTYTQTGGFRDPSSAIATPAGSNIQQNIKMQYGVSRNMSVPSIGAFAGGDPTAGRYAEAFGAGTALVYWAGIYHSVAQTRWLQAGTCAQISFDPPSNSRQPVLGSEVMVKAEVKTKGGESSKGNFLNARTPTGGGTVSPPSGPADVRAPLTFTYKAPTTRSPNAGFSVNATSRAGVANGEWKTGLGTGWSGQLSCTFQAKDAGDVELQSWSLSDAASLTIDVRNGVGTVNAYREVRDTGTNRRKALRGQSIVLLFDNGYTTDGSVQSQSPATVTVNFDQAGKYSIGASIGTLKAGSKHNSTCAREACRESDLPLEVVLCLGNMSGPSTDPNQVRGSATEVKSGGRLGNGTTSRTATWDLARQGTTR